MILRSVFFILCFPLLLSAAPAPRALPAATVHPFVRATVVRPLPLAERAAVLLHQAAPVPRQTAQGCTRQNAVAVLRRFVYGKVQGADVAIGSVEAWSCISVEDAQAQLAALDSGVRNNAACWYHVGQPSGDCPARPEGGTP